MSAKGLLPLKEFPLNNNLHLPQSPVPNQCDAFTIRTHQTPNQTQFQQQQSSSTDEGCEMEHEDLDEQIQSQLPFSLQRLNSLTSSSSSSGVIANYPTTKCLSENVSCESSQSNLSTFENLNLNITDNVDMIDSQLQCNNTNDNTTIIDKNNASDNGDIKCL